MVIRRERPADEAAVDAVTTAAFGAPGGGEPVETRLLRDLRADPGWIPALSLVAEGPDGAVAGHVVCTRGAVGGAPALGLGPISVAPERQRAGIGSALMHAVVAAAEASGERLVCLLGDPAYYGRFGFVAAADRRRRGAGSRVGRLLPGPRARPGRPARPVRLRGALRPPLTRAECGRRDRAGARGRLDGPPARRADAARERLELLAHAGLVLEAGELGRGPAVEGRGARAAAADGQHGAAPRVLERERASAA